MMGLVALAGAVVPSVLPAEVLVVVEKSRIERWEPGPERWRKTGLFLDGEAEGLKPVSVAATADGKVYVACEDKPATGSIEEFDATGKHLRTLAKFGFRPFALVAHPDGKRLVQTHNASNVKAYSLRDGAESDYITDAPDHVCCVHFGPDGNCWLATDYYSLVAVFEDAATGAAKKIGEFPVYACYRDFAFGGEDLTRLVIPSAWYESVDLVTGETDVSYPTNVPMNWCQATVRVGGEVYAADYKLSRIVRLPSVGGPVTVVAEAPDFISGMCNLTEALDGSERRRFAAAQAKLKAKGTRLFTDGLPKLPNGMWDVERMKFNNPGLEVDLSVGIWPVVRILRDGLCIGSTSVPRTLTRRFVRKGTIRYDAGADTAWPKVPPAANVRLPPFGEPPAGSCHFRDYETRERHFADLTGDGRPDCIELYGDVTEYGALSPACPVAYGADGRWTNSPIQVFAYLHVRSGDGAEGRWLAPVPILCDGKKDLQGSFGCGGAVFEDFDGDGLTDMIGGDFRSEIWFYRNVGTKERPAFAHGCRLTDPSGRQIEGRLCMMDLQGYDSDGDGRTDLVVSEEDGCVSWFRNLGERRNGRPVFATQEFFRQEADELKFGCLATPFAVDWDGDGDEDLIVGNSAGYIAFIENLSGRGEERPKWAEPKLFTVLDPEACTAKLWLEGDVIRSRCGDSDSPQGPAESKWGYTVLSVADWDGDGFLDIMANDVKGSVVLIRNPGSRGTTAMEAPRPVEVEWEGEQPRFAWEWRKPTGRALRAMWRTTPLMYDWNGDGLVDLIMLDHEGHLALYPRARRGGKTVLLPPQRVFLDEQGQSKTMCGVNGGSGRRKFCITDWNGDGRPDFVFQGANAYVLENLGTDADGRTRFAKTRQLARKRLAGHTSCPTACDFNADGVPDLVIGAEDGHFYYYRNPNTKRDPTLVASAADRTRLPMYREKGGGWARGFRPSKIVAWECTARNALVTDSVRIVGADGRALRHGVDYRIEPTWGTIGLLAAAASRTGETMTVSYDYRLQRIDSTVMSADGRRAVRRGVPHVHMPEPPVLAAGERLVENALVTPDREVRCPAAETAAQAPRTPPGAAAFTPKVLAKLRRGEPVTVLAWGDSVTECEFLPAADKWQEVFVRRLRKKFPQSEITLVSNGWGGRTTRAFLMEPEGSEYNFTNTVLNVRADLVISEFVNDCGLTDAMLQETYPRLLREFRAAGKEWVILTPHYVRPDWMGLKSSRDCDDDPRRYVRFVRAFAADNRVGLADASLRWGHLWREGIPYETMFVNSINHPNRLGMSFFADALMDFFGD